MGFLRVFMGDFGVFEGKIGGLRVFRCKIGVFIVFVGNLRFFDVSYVF
jgi:hypothetical protein